MIKETREIKDVNQVALRGYGELFIKQGDQESLEIETEERYMDRVKTRVQKGVLKIDVVGEFWHRFNSIFSRGYNPPRVKYYLMVKDLTGLKVSGAGRVEIDELWTEKFTVSLDGAAEMRIDALDAEYLRVDMPGAGNINIRGEVEKQNVTLDGAGAYSARKLECQSANVAINGVGKAIVWAVEELDVRVTGIGSVEYYGNPRVTKSVSGLGSITRRE